MKLEYKNIGMVDADYLIKQLQEWQNELIDDDVYDEIIYNTLDTVIDLIVEGGE